MGEGIKSNLGRVINRDKTIDVLKGIGIILVVIGHSGCPHLLLDYINSFHIISYFLYDY